MTETTRRGFLRTALGGIATMLGVSAFANGREQELGREAVVYGPPARLSLEHDTIVFYGRQQGKTFPKLSTPTLPRGTPDQQVNRLLSQVADDLSRGPWE